MSEKGGSPGESGLPFKEAEKRTHKFLSSLYFAFLVDEIATKHQRLEDELIVAVLEDDEGTVKDRQQQMDACDLSFILAGSVLDLEGEMDS